MKFKNSLPVLCAIFGIILVSYSSFIYDPTISTSDPSSCESYAENYDALQCLKRELDKSINGERVVNIYRLQEQNRIFYTGLLLLFLGTIGILRSRKEQE